MKRSVNIEIKIYSNVISPVLLCGCDLCFWHEGKNIDRDFLRRSADENIGVYAGESKKEDGGYYIMKSFIKYSPQ